MTASIDKVIRDAMARTLWVWAWGNYNGGEGPPMLTTRDGDVHVPFSAWDDPKAMRELGASARAYTDWQAWATPQAAYNAADSLVQLYRRQDAREYGPWSGVTPSMLLSAAMLADQETDDLDVENATYFGHMLAEMALERLTMVTVHETGEQRLDSSFETWGYELRSWFHNHAQFPLAIPNFTCTLEEVSRLDLFGFRTHELQWEGVLLGNVTRGAMATSIFGDEPRIEYGGDEPEFLGEDIAKLGTGGYRRDLGTAGDVVVDHLLDLLQTESLVAGTGPNYYVETRNDGTEQRFLVEGISPSELTKASTIIHDTMTANGGRVTGRGVLRRWGRLVYINTGDRTWKPHTYVLWTGPPGNSIVVYADGLDDAFNEMMDYIDEFRPGLIVDEQVNSEIARLIGEFTVEHGREPDENEMNPIYEEAEAGTVSGGNAGQRIASDAWGITAEDPTPERLASIARE